MLAYQNIGHANAFWLLTYCLGWHQFGSPGHAHAGLQQNMEEATARKSLPNFWQPNNARAGRRCIQDVRHFSPHLLTFSFHPFSATHHKSQERARWDLRLAASGFDKHYSGGSQLCSTFHPPLSTETHHIERSISRWSLLNQSTLPWSPFSCDDPVPLSNFYGLIRLTFGPLMWRSLARNYYLLDLK
jgi:hypothetical protein